MEAVKVTASRVISHSSTNNFNRECQLRGLDGKGRNERQKQARRELYHLIMLRQERPLTVKDVEKKFEQLCRDHGYDKEIEKLRQSLEKTRDLSYKNPEAFAIQFYKSLEELSDLVAKEHVEHMLNEGKLTDAEQQVDEFSKRKKHFIEDFKKSYEDSLRRMHDLHKAKVISRHAYKHLIIYALMFLAQPGNQAAQNAQQAFTQLGNAVVRMLP
jgi:hypothetical protein